MKFVSEVHCTGAHLRGGAAFLSEGKTKTESLELEYRQAQLVNEIGGCSLI